MLSNKWIEGDIFIQVCSYITRLISNINHSFIKKIHSKLQSNDILHYKSWNLKFICSAAELWYTFADENILSSANSEYLNEVNAQQKGSIFILEEQINCFEVVQESLFFWVKTVFLFGLARYKLWEVFIF